ncbi:MAG TPA: metal ABC transporter permease [Acetobacteraceae bacterium]|nr:metal ABC transporter permease [Acetobacteraceae bacterium]
MPSWLALIFAPGFFASPPVQTAMIVGGGAAMVSGIVGVFTVMRGQSFAGHALADVSSAGGSASFLLGINPLLGFLGMAILAAGGTELAGTRFARERDLVTGIMLGAGLGLAALFLYFDVTSRSTTGAAVTVMFGSMFSIPASIIPLALAVGATALGISVLFYRPLLLASLSPDLAEVQGVRVRMTGLLHLLVLAFAVSLSAMTVGAILSTALLIGPAATALRLAKHPGQAIALAMLIGVIATWGGILLAYDSFSWTRGHGWPVSFFIVSLIFAFYLASAPPEGGRKRSRIAEAGR